MPPKPCPGEEARGCVLPLSQRFEVVQPLAQFRLESTRDRGLTLNLEKARNQLKSHGSLEVSVLAT